MDRNHFMLSGRLAARIRSDRILVAVRTDYTGHDHIDLIEAWYAGPTEGEAFEALRALPINTLIEAEGWIERPGMAAMALRIDPATLVAYPDGRPGEPVGRAWWEPDEDEAPAPAPLTRTYQIVVRAEYEAGEPVSSPRTFARWVQEALDGALGGGITDVTAAPNGRHLHGEPVLSLQLEACEPMELLREPTGGVFIRLIEDTINAHNCLEVELLGPPNALRVFVAEHWGLDDDELDESLPQLR